MHRAPEEEGEWRTRKKNKCFGRIRGQNGLRYQSAKRSTYRPTYLVVYKVCLRDRRASFDACANLGRTACRISMPATRAFPAPSLCQWQGQGTVPCNENLATEDDAFQRNCRRQTDRPSDCAPACIVDGRASSVPLWRRGWKVDGWGRRAAQASNSSQTRK